jgi:MOSC domain-containing protein YiiM
MVSWNSSGGRATGRVTRVIRNGKVKVPGADFYITGTPDDPAALIRVYRNGKPTDTIVGHKVKTLRASAQKSIWSGMFKDYRNI